MTAERIGEILEKMEITNVDRAFRELTGVTRKIYNKALHARNAKVIRDESFFLDRPKTYYFGYASHHLKKRSGGHRTISAPHPDLLVLQQKLLEFFLQYPVHSCCHGFVRGRSFVTAAKKIASVRSSHPWVFFFDVRDAFPSINAGALKNTFASLGLAERLISRFVLFTALQSGSLPQGAPTSPHLLNLVYHPIDKAIAKFCRKHKIHYVRYADNLIFACPAPISKNTHFLKGPIDIVRTAGLRIHQPVVADNPHEDLSLLGLRIAGREISLPPQTKERFRLILFQASKDSKYHEKAQGVISYLTMVYGALPDRFAHQLASHTLLPRP